MSKKLTSIVLALCMIISCIAVGSFATSAASAPKESVSASLDSGSVSSNSYGLPDNIENGNILHCFDWTYNDIKAELQHIAESGFTAVQTSPVQYPDPLGQWYGLYLPRAFACTTSPLGTKDELQALCTEAHNYGIKVVCDVVANHLTGDHANIQDDLKPLQYWHDEFEVSDWNNRYQVTYGKIGMADLKTEDSYVQNVVFNYLQSLKAIGVDGFRFDAAKHIGLPSEGDGFWQKMAQIGTYRYGEILDQPGGNNPSGTMVEYSNYIGITDSVYSGTIMGAVRDGTVNLGYGGNWVNQGVPANKIVYWAESHDTYSNKTPDQGEGGWTKYIPQNKIDRAYAVVGAKANSQSLYLSRPFQTDKEAIMSGQKGSTHFTATEVAQVNKFHNAMVGTGEYMTSGNNCYVVCRGDGSSTGGAVVVAASGENMSVTVPNGGGLVPSGTYTDAVSGATWTVNGSTLSGQIGSSGIAVIYNAETGPSVSASPNGSPYIYTTDTLSISLGYSDATSAQYALDNGGWVGFTNGQTITIGSGLAYNTVTTLHIKATDGTKTKEATYTYKKVNPSEVTTIYFDNSSYNWSAVCAYVYNDSGSTVVENAGWPGEAMTFDSSLNLYKYVVPTNLKSNSLVIFNNNNQGTQYPSGGTQAQGLPISGVSMILRGTSWEPYGDTPTPSTDPTSPPVSSVLIGDADQNGRISVKDATYIQMHLAQIITLTGDAYIAADANKDNVVDVKDTTAVQRYLARFNDANNYVGTYTGGTQPVTQPETQPVTQPETQPPTNLPSNTVTFNGAATSNGAEKWYAWTWCTSSGRWVEGSGSGSTVTFSGLEANVIFVRSDPSKTIDWNNNSVWNKTENQTTVQGGTFTTTGWNGDIMNGSWG